MSYEGYEVWYCPKGHRVLQMGAHCYFADDEEADRAAICPICGEKACTYDEVDETNGCYCEGMTAEDLQKHGKCPCHESVETVAGYDPFPCQRCKGTGEVEITVSWQWVSCDACGPETSHCEKCKDYGLIPVPDKVQKIECPCCFGRGTVYAEVWDISHLLERDRKQREQEAKFREEHYVNVSVKEFQDKGCWEQFYQDEDLASWEEQDEITHPEMKFTLSKVKAAKYGFLKEADQEDEVK